MSADGKCPSKKGLGRVINRNSSDRLFVPKSLSFLVFASVNGAFNVVPQYWPKDPGRRPVRGSIKNLLKREKQSGSKKRSILTTFRE